MLSANEYAQEAIIQAVPSTLGNYDKDNLLDEARDNITAEVIYYSDAEGVISDYESDYGDEADDICGGKEYKASDWIQARQDYANALLYCATGGEINSAVDDMDDNIELFRAEVERLEGDPDEATFDNDCKYGWEAHNYETAEGVMIWSNERIAGSYNPNLLEGELIAVSFRVMGGLWLNLAWKPE